MGQFNTNIFDKNTTLLDLQRLQDDFEMKKQLAAGQIANYMKPEMGLKDILMMQLAQQNKEQDFGLRRDALDQQLQIARENNQARLDAQKEKIEEKKNQKKLVDQNLLGGYVSEVDKQINLVNELIGKDATLDPVTGEVINATPLEGIGGNFGKMSVLPNIPGGDAANARAKLDQLKSKALLETLGEMKNQSATGASGMGALSNTEGKIIGAAAVPVDPNQSMTSFVKNALKYRQELQASKQRSLSNFKNLYGVDDGTSTNMPQAPMGGGTISPDAARAELIRRGVIKQ